MPNHRRHQHATHEAGEEEPNQHEPTAHEQIELLAYRYWVQRGRPVGDPETDWYKAEHELARQREAATRL
jgi:hypothetical protein